MLRNFIITAYRSLLRNKVYFFLGVIGLTLGISCVVALYTIINFQSNFDTHQADSDQIYRVIAYYNTGEREGRTSTVPHPLAEAVREELPSVTAISNLYLLSDQVNIQQSDGEIKKIKQEKIAFAEPDIFNILTFNWLEGSVNNENPDAVYLSRSVAEKFFGKESTSDILGRSITLANTHNLTIEGIYEDLPKNTDFPFHMITGYQKQEGVNPYFGEGKIWGRLNGGTQCILKVEKNANFSQVLVNINKAFEKHNVIDGYELELQPLAKVHEEPVGNYGGVTFEPKYKTISYTLAIFLALIGGINFINLTTARAIKRAKEVGIRKVMGGVRIELILQFIIETFIIVMISVGAGFLIGEQILSLFEIMFGMSISLSDVSLMDWVTFSLIVTIGMTLVSGAYPALVLSRFSAINAIKTKVSNIDQQSRFPLRKVLVGLQFGFSIALIIGATVIFTQMNYMKNYNMGFRSDGILNLKFPAPDFDRQNRLKNQLEKLPEIEGVSLHLGSPMASTNNTDQYFNPEIGKDELYTVNDKSIDEDYLDLFALQLISGRNLNSNDPRENILISEVALSKFKLGNAHDAIGKEIEAKWGQRSKIVGVIKDFNSQSLRSEMTPVILSYYEKGFYELAMKISSNADIAETLEKIQTEWDTAYPELLIDYGFLDDQIARRYQFEEVMAKSISFFVFISLIISILGLYGLTDYLANSKRKEIGIRKVVGATITHILKLFVKEVFFLLLIAFAIASAGSYWLMNSWLEGFNYRVSIGWEIILGTFIITAIISLVTMGSRSLSAARVNPVDVLKDE